MTASWRVEDVIDLEFFLHQDETAFSRVPEKNLQQRDRQIFLENIQPRLRQEPPAAPRPFILKAYLEHRRGMESGASPLPNVLPGRIYQESLGLLKWIVLGAAGLIGLSGALAFLNYGGVQPLNVGLYLAVFVLPQVVMLTVFLGVRLWRRLVRRPQTSSLLGGLAGQALLKTTRWLQRTARKHLSASQRTGIDATLGLLRGRHSVYGSLFFWPLFNLLQGTGVAFNLGVLGATLFKLSSADLAFGWQSTFQISSQGVYQLVQWLARPWSWLIPEPLGHPALAQIQGSHMVLKDGIYHLQTADLVSWWPFLLLMVLVYGLLPRLALLITGKLILRHKLQHLTLNHAPCLRLCQRLETPLVHTLGQSVPVSALSNGATPDYQSPASDATLKTQAPASEAVLLIPPDLAEYWDPRELAGLQRLTPHLAIRTVLKVSEDADLAPQLAALDLMKCPSGAHVLVLQEAWQPPIRQTLHFMKTLRHSLGPEVPIQVALVGKPDQETLLTPAKAVDRHVWQQKLLTLGDPRLMVTGVVPEP